MVLSNFLVIS